MAKHGKHDLAHPLRSQPQADSRSHILLADDDADMRKLLAFMLRSEGYKVVECVNGLELLEQLKAVCMPHALYHPDLVISDVRMPGMSGLEVLRRLRDCNGLPPIMFITAFGDEQTHRQARQLGAVASIDKPFENRRFLELVAFLLTNFRLPGNADDDISNASLEEGNG